MSLDRRQNAPRFSYILVRVPRWRRVTHRCGGLCGSIRSRHCDKNNRRRMTRKWAGLAATRGPGVDGRSGPSARQIANTSEPCAGSSARNNAGSAGAVIGVATRFRLPPNDHKKKSRMLVGHPAEEHPQTARRRPLVAVEDPFRPIVRHAPGRRSPSRKFDT